MRPTFSSEALLGQLEADLREGIAFIQGLTPEALDRRPDTGGWNGTEILAHLNFYASFYTQAIAKAMAVPVRTAKPNFKAGWLGQYFVSMIGPAPEGQALARKISSPKNSRPAALEVPTAAEAVKQFLAHQEELLRLVQAAGRADLGRVRVPISLTPLIRLKLGDTFRFVIAHQQRHFQQIARGL
jgi:hypothetical protein